MKSSKLLFKLFYFVGENEKRLSFEEFLPIYHEQTDKQQSSSIEAFIEAFRIFDLDSNGLISGGEIRHLLTMLGRFCRKINILNAL